MDFSEPELLCLASAIVSGRWLKRPSLLLAWLLAYACLTGWLVGFLVGGVWVSWLVGQSVGCSSLGQFFSSARVNKGGHPVL